MFDTLPNLPDPPERRVIAHCAFCGAELYEGEEALYDPAFDEYFCDKDCAAEHYIEIGGLAKVVLAKEANRHGS
jgi:hypothetical protein